jgi:hypothetical protein
MHAVGLCWPISCSTKGGLQPKHGACDVTQAQGFVANCIKLQATVLLNLLCIACCVQESALMCWQAWCRLAPLQ